MKGHQWWREKRPKEEWPLYEDFKAFLWLVWVHLELPNPTPVQYDIASYLQHGPRRKLIEAFRGVGKSWITSAFVCWRLLRDPDRKILVVSASKDRADQFSTFTLRLIAEVPILQHLQPRTDQRNSKIAFDVGPARADHSPSVKSVGIFGQLTGSRADDIVADDVEVPNTAETQTQRDKLAERVKEFDAILKPGGEITYLGTPQTEDSLYNALPERGYEARIWPARFLSLKEAERYNGRLAPKIMEAIERGVLPGSSTDPKRFSDIDLMEREASYGRSGFALQFMLDTSLSDQDRYPLKLSDLLVTSCAGEMVPEKLMWSQDPQYVIEGVTCVGLRGDRYYRPAMIVNSWVKPTGCIMAIDPSGRGADETTYAVVKQLNGYLFLVDAGGFLGGYDDDTMEALVGIAKKHSAQRILIESNFGDGMFEALLKPFLRKTYPCTTEEVRHSKQKELRIIDTLEPVMNQHRLVVDRSLLDKDYQSTADLPQEKRLQYQLFYQMSRITKDRGALAHDDRLDVLAMAVDYWMRSMAQDVDERMARRQEEVLKAELDVFLGRPGISLDLLAMGADTDLAMRAARGGNGSWMNGIRK